MTQVTPMLSEDFVYVRGGGGGGDKIIQSCSKLVYLTEPGYINKKTV